jgi:predicted nuclease of predicted toxin-antitoxin system
VNPGEKEFARIWSWQPKSKTVSLISATDTITYNRAKVTEEFVSTDKAFVNDSFWFSFPFHLVWDEITVEELGQTTSPILQKEAFKIKINYPQEGGYTPGDSYEIYIDDNHNILEWTYHPKGQEEPALGNTFENQKTFNGIKIDTEHSNPEKGFQLNFRDVVIK